MSQNESNLTPQQIRTIDALLTEGTHEKAAQKAKVARSTVTRWLAEPEFKTAYSDARNQMIEGVLTALQAASLKAVETLTNVMDDKHAQSSAKVSAAKTVLDNLLRAREHITIEDRLRDLEQQKEIYGIGSRWKN